MGVPYLRNLAKPPAVQVPGLGKWGSIVLPGIMATGSAPRVCWRLPQHQGCVGLMSYGDGSSRTRRPTHQWRISGWKVMLWTLIVDCLTVLVVASEAWCGQRCDSLFVVYLSSSNGSPIQDLRAVNLPLLLSWLLDLL